MPPLSSVKCVFFWSLMIVCCRAGRAHTLSSTYKSRDCTGMVGTGKLKENFLKMLDSIQVPKLFNRKKDFSKEH